MRFSAEEWWQVREAAERTRQNPAVFLRTAALLAATDPVPARPTRGQLTRIHAEARRRGHVWTEAELRARHLPLYWDEDWVRARLAEGRSLKEIATLCGYSHRSVGHHLHAQFGICGYHKLDPAAQDAIRTQVAAGQSRDEVAAALGVSVNTVARHTRGLEDQRDRRFRDKATAVGEWPAPLSRIAEVCFDGHRNRAASWCRDMIRSGRLKRQGRGWYTPVEGEPPELPSETPELAGPLLD